MLDYAMLVKMYTNDRTAETRYCPAECTGTTKVATHRKIYRIPVP